jgi:hypothetical protein
VAVSDEVGGTRLCGRQKQDLGIWGGLKVGAPAGDGNSNYNIVGW